ncbi:MAG: chemotaxis protein CheW, partial [Acidobacteria bacterium]|nr:chemotaxis protein CheW [Candidatus Sulfomarinibacter kjeldsenii]
VERVQEVIRDSDITPVPTAPPWVRGLINLRGQIVTAIDLGTRFGKTDRDNQSPTVLVLDVGSTLLSFVVDRAGDVVEVNDESFEPPPDTLKGEARRLIRGTYKLQERLLLVLDVEQALEIDAATVGDNKP